MPFPSRAQLGLVLALAVTTHASAQYSPQVGQPHPDFTLPRIDNRQPASLADYRGKKLLLINFASW